MGLDMSYRTIPPDCQLLKMAAGKPTFGVYLGLRGFQKISADELKRQTDNADFLEYAAEAEKIRRAHPGIENRYLDFGRKWDMLHYLLSENRRTKSAAPDKEDWVFRAIHGDESLGDDFRMPQGVPICYINPVEAKQIWAKLDGIAANALHIHWNPQMMQTAGVYKIHAEDTVETLQWIKQDFERLKNFYLWAAIYNEGVLVICD